MLGSLRKRLFGVPLAETTFARRGFTGGQATTRAHLERIGRTFLQGYHAALEDARPAVLNRQLLAIDCEVRGFAFEGAAMGLALRDLFTPWRRRHFAAFLRGPGADHIYMMHVGVGWLWARLHYPVAGPMTRLHPLYRWLALDGYGFHEGYFHWPRTITRQAVPGALHGYTRRAFDQGLGRSLWFVHGTEVPQIATTIAAFPAPRRADLWSGVGLACAYAGGADPAAIQSLRAAAGSYTPQLAQGASFAAKARQRAGNLTPHTEQACTILCGMTADAAAAVTDAALLALAANGAEPAYEVWRRRIQAHFVA